MRLLLCFCWVAASMSAAEISKDQVNKAIGLDLFSDENLWDDDSKILSDRLAWPKESETTVDASYRILKNFAQS